MLRRVTAFDGHLSILTLTALRLCLLLSACGGSGSEVASIPPPPPAPTPTPTPPPSVTVTSIDVSTTWLDSPATRAGSDDLIGLVDSKTGANSSSRFPAPGEFQLQISKAGDGFTYTLGGPSSFLPDGLAKITLPVWSVSWDFNAGGPNYRYDNPWGDYSQFFGQNLKEYDVYSDGTKKLREDYSYDRESYQNVIVLPTGDAVSESILFDAGLSYVAMGEWSWGTVTLNADGTSTPTGDSRSIYFVYGDRTPASAIPTAGTATYDAHTLGELPFTLTADFGDRSISTEISEASVFDVSGSAPFGNDGSFVIPLTGNAGTQTATGTMDGAFFGPQAEQVGGVVSVEGPDGNALMQDAFVGQQQPPH